MTPLRITLLQTDIVWEDKAANLENLFHRLQALEGQTDLLVLPEMFSTGFSMNVAEQAETSDGPTIGRLRQWATQFHIALAGSFMARTPGSEGPTSSTAYYNRAFFVAPGQEPFFQDKRHLFRMGGEADRFAPGHNRAVCTYKGWKILLLVCYDLRFPVWSRNRHNEYDLLLYVANWPASRRLAWDTLLKARAIENLCYTCGVNRIGHDGNDIAYNGGTALISPKGKCLASVADDLPGHCSATIDLDRLHAFRQKFPAWMDADPFSLRATEAYRP